MTPALPTASSAYSLKRDLRQTPPWITLPAQGSTYLRGYSVQTNGASSIHILAKNKIILQAGQSSVTLEGSNITFACPGSFSVKGGGNAFTGPGSSPPQVAALPDSRAKIYQEQFKAIDSTTGLAVPNQPYRIELADGSIIRGLTDEFGRTEKIATSDPQSLALHWEPISSGTNETPDADTLPESC